MTNKQKPEDPSVEQAIAQLYAAQQRYAEAWEGGDPDDIGGAAEEMLFARDALIEAVERRQQQEIEKLRDMLELKRRSFRRLIEQFSELAEVIGEDKPENGDHTAVIVSLLKFKLEQAESLLTSGADASAEIERLKQEAENHKHHRMQNLKDALAWKARAERAESALQWQPIESAPKDWTHVLLAEENGDVCEGYYSHADGGDDCWYRANTSGRDEDAAIEPTLWMPLPAVPPSAPPRGDQ